jgi:hypothetical protein
MAYFTWEDLKKEAEFRLLQVTKQAKELRQLIKELDFKVQSGEEFPVQFECEEGKWPNIRHKHKVR